MSLLVSAAVFVVEASLRLGALGVSAGLCRRARTRGDGLAFVCALAAVAMGLCGATRAAQCAWSCTHACTIAGGLVAARTAHRPTYREHAAAFFYVVFSQHAVFGGDTAALAGRFWGPMALCARQAGARAAVHVCFVGSKEVPRTWGGLTARHAEGAVVAATTLYVAWALYSRAANTVALAVYGVFFLPLEVDRVARLKTTTRHQNQE